MEFPPDWVILPMGDFDLAIPRDPGPLGMEVMSQIRSTGRLMDHFRIGVGGSESLRATFRTSQVYLDAQAPDLILTWELRPSDVIIRRNMATSDWLDLNNLIASNDIIARDEGGEVCNEDMIAFIDTQPLKDRPLVASSVRWAVGVGSDNRMELQLQSLPASAPTLTGKPGLRG